VVYKLGQKPPKLESQEGLPGYAGINQEDLLF